MPSIFSKIAAGELPCYKVAETNEFLAFLDINPLSKGHTLVIPKKETDYLFNLELEEYLGLWKFSKKVAKAMDQVIDCERIGVTVIGLEVPHTHIHLIPINVVSDINFERPKKQFSYEQMIGIAEKIKQAL